jgi:flagellar hook-basal body complex protein FliE
MAIDMLIGAAQTLTSGTSRLGAGTSGSLMGGASGSASDAASSFTRLLEGVERSASEANDAVSSMVDKTGDVHDAMIALQRAEMSLELTVQIRNKLVQAYQDVMRMPI